jgi:hypothetical protein
MPCLLGIILDSRIASIHPTAILVILRVAVSFREPFSPPQGAVVALPEKSKTGKSCLSSAFHKHLSAPHLLVARSRCAHGLPLPRRHRQGGDPSCHRPEEPTRQTTLGQQQPMILAGGPTVIPAARSVCRRPLSVPIWLRHFPCPQSVSRARSEFSLKNNEPCPLVAAALSTAERSKAERSEA